MIDRKINVSQKSGIYCFYNKINSKRYIGQAVNINNRFHRHLAACFNRNEDALLYRSLKKYGLESFDFIILKECKIEELGYWETYYISYYKTNICRYGDKFGYNLTDGGDGGTLGYKWTKEQKDNQRQVQIQVMLDYFKTEKGKKQAKHHSEVMKGKKPTKEAIEKTRQKLKLVKHTEEWNKKIGDKNRGKKHTVLSRKHMSDAHIGKSPSNKGVPRTKEQNDLLHKVTTGSWYMTAEFDDHVYQVIPRKQQDFIDAGYYRCMGRKNREPWHEKVIKKEKLSNTNKGSWYMTKPGDKVRYVIPEKQSAFIADGYYRCHMDGTPWKKVA